MVRNTRDEPDAVILASGSEVELAVKAAGMVAGKSVRVVSVLSRELFLAQPAPLRDAMVPPKARVIGCEAGRAVGWEGLVDAFVGIERFGESAPGATVAAHLGLTPEALAAAVSAS